MYKNIHRGIKIYNLDKALYHLHKEGLEKSDFGMDNTSDLFEGGFGLYSSKDLKKRIGPVKTEYFRIGFVRAGSASFEIGLEKFCAEKNSIIFGFPGQVFSLYDQSDDFFCYCMLFKESFAKDAQWIKHNRITVPFLNYSGIQCFKLYEEEANEIEQIIFKINNEIKNKRPGTHRAIELYIEQVILLAGRCYPQQPGPNQEPVQTGKELFSKFIRLVSEHFLSLHKVSDYAELLNISADHLNRTIKFHSGKTAHKLIDEMLLTEAKAYLKHSDLSIGEIAYQLEFNDPSHFNKFFKKLSGCTPQDFRSKSD